ncbi:MAG: hypothetical protein GX276_02630 [Clostridiaceae bacterium]|nr:hypothetical protein [Clostridiaceae bacterium]
MYQRSAIMMIVLSLLIGTCSCGSVGITGETIDARLLVDLTVPDHSDISFQLQWYRISDQFPTSLKDASDMMYMVGQEVTLEGENIDQLSGALLSVRLIDLADLTGKDYFRTLLIEEDYVYKNGRYLNAEGIYREPRSADIMGARRLLDNYIAKAKVLLFSMSYEGSVTKAVRVWSMEIEELAYRCDFELFQIKPEALPGNDTQELFADFQPSSYGGVLAGPSLANCGYLFVQGKAEKAISDISCRALNKGCRIIGPDADEMDRSICGGRTSPPPKTGDFSAGESVDLVFDYIFADPEDKPLRTYDLAVACLLTSFDMSDGRVLHSYHYQPSMRSPEFALVHLLHAYRSTHR